MTVQVIKRDDALFQVKSYIVNPDDTYNTLLHAALFENEDDARTLRTKVQSALDCAYGSLSALDLRVWTWNVDADSAWINLRSPSTATPWRVGVDPIPAL